MPKSCHVTKLLCFYTIIKKNWGRENEPNLAVRRSFAQPNLLTLDYVKLISRKKIRSDGRKFADLSGFEAAKLDCSWGDGQYFRLVGTRASLLYNFARISQVALTLPRG